MICNDSEGEKVQSMKKCFLLGAALLLGAHSGAPALAHAAGKVKVVATTPIFGEIIREVGGERVDVKVLLPAGRDVHFYEPRPSDIVKISRADLFAHGGLDLELWRGPLVEAAGKRSRDGSESLLPSRAGTLRPITRAGPISGGHSI